MYVYYIYHSVIIKKIETWLGVHFDRSTFGMRVLICKHDSHISRHCSETSFIIYGDRS